jgi:hypothetical protein
MSLNTNHKEEGKTEMENAFTREHANDGEEICYFNEFPKKWIAEKKLRHELAADCIMIGGLILGIGAIICIGIVWG